MKVIIYTLILITIGCLVIGAVDFLAAVLVVCGIMLGLILSLIIIVYG